ncbi:putative enoyl-CoA hydratase echA8 [Methyloligella halotolerans]|uniref:Enoyl-CoA hydratase domain-containing protein 3, mitochondrial n=1 Tax=Methyloligella halotolerans TaxID=1177755 RepID=A0A1E2S274_9HYPH|nr:enoyl-CoA hydratase [Methyloligella halotolerans]ODA68551.1 putative enoyl-CoA hydratase echA8 [Methyloligella halotolerans]
MDQMETVSGSAAPETGEPPYVLREVRGAVAVLTLNRPDQRNALSLGMIAALTKEIRALGQKRDVKVIVLTGDGPAFSSGHDLKELTRHRGDEDNGRSFYVNVMTACSRLMLSIVRSPKPVIAAVNGIATAAGCQLVASCDLAVASEESRFATPGVNIGLFCSTPMVALSRNVPPKAAMEMLLTGEMVPAAQAQVMGLINRAVPADRLMDETMALADTIASKPRATVKIGKEAFYRQAELSLDEAYGYAATVMVDNMLHAEAQEGIGAFLEKRKPCWPDGE